METINSIKRTLPKALFIICAILLAYSCTSDDDSSTKDDGILRALRTTPALTGDDPLILPVNFTIEIVFSHSLKTEAVASALSIEGGSAGVDYALSFDETNSIATISTNSDLQYNANYTLSLPAGDYGQDGERLQEALTIPFITEAFVQPFITLETNMESINENAEEAIITATLNKEAEADVQVTLNFEGTATLDEDYTVSSTSLTIPMGELSGSITLTSMNDQEVDDNEDIIITIASIENATDQNATSTTLTIVEELAPLSLKGILALNWSGSGTNDGKAIHVKANMDIEDLSIYGIGVANNGGGTDGQEYTFPAISISAGDDVLIARSPDAISTYFEGCTTEFEEILEAESAIAQNGDDAIELYMNGNVVEIFGDPDVDGTGMPWEYTSSWAYKVGRDWTYGGVGCSESSATNATSSCPYPICAEALELKGVMALSWDGSGSNGGKAIHLRANKDIEDISIYALGIANNGGGTDGVEFVLPQMAVSEGDDILIARETSTLATYFGDCINQFEHLIASNDAVSQNGDDAIELFENETVIETYGDADTDGTGLSWEYSGSWAYKSEGSWMTGGLDCAAGSTSTQESSCPYPLCQ